MPETWLDLSREARRSAQILLTEAMFRSCLSRAYYAAYARVAHELDAQPNVMFPSNREGPNHPGELGTGGIRRLIETSLPAVAPDRRAKLSEWIARLYIMRIDADYRPSARIEARDARAAVSLMSKVFDAL